MMDEGHYSSSVTIFKNVVVLLDILLGQFPSRVWDILSPFSSHYTIYILSLRNFSQKNEYRI